MAYTALELTDLLKQAREAYHDLVLGRAARVVIDQNGERVEFTPANRQALATYIQTLEQQFSALTGVASVVRGPAGFMF